MKKGWNITEKVIATLLQAWALFYLYLLTAGINTKLNFGLQVGQIKKEDISFWELFKIFHFNYIAGVFCFLAGLGLLYDKKTGWIASLISSLVFAGFLLTSGRNGVTKSNNPHLATSISYIVVAIAFAAIFLVLVLKPFRQKYKPTTANWLVVLGAVILAVIDTSVLGGM
ncbi:MAG TPA: hypothetical protein VHB48_20640 [Chitinophagaceae bacterium]|jgi:hypothetical protein|nr:hypothetical protein [Chitinophagaceae bacterium]